MIIVREKFIRVPGALLGIAFLSATVLALSRPDGPVWSVLTVAVLMFVAERRLYSGLLKNKLLIRMGGLWVAGLILAAWWIVAEKASLVLPGQTYAPGTSLFYITKSVLGTTHIFTDAMIGLLGWNNAPVPFISIFLWYIGIGSLLVLAFAAYRKRNIRTLLGLLMMMGAVTLIPVAYTYIYAQRYGDILQGRYMLPGAVGIAIIAATLAKETIMKPASLAKTLIALTALGNVFAYVWILRQYMVGLSFFNIFKNVPGGWTPPIPAILLIIIFVLINLFIVTYLWRISDEVSSKQNVAGV